MVRGFWRKKTIFFSFYIKLVRERGRDFRVPPRFVSATKKLKIADGVFWRMKEGPKFKF